MGLGKGLRMAGVAALLASSLFVAGCESSGSGNDGSLFSLRSGFGLNGAGGGNGNGVGDGDGDGGGPRSPGPGTGSPIGFNPGGTGEEGAIFISTGSNPTLKALSGTSFAVLVTEALTGNPSNTVYAPDINSLLTADDDRGDGSPSLFITDLDADTITSVPYDDDASGDEAGGDDVAHDPNLGRIFAPSGLTLRVFDDTAPFAQPPDSGQFTGGQPQFEVEVDTSRELVFVTAGNPTLAEVHVFDGNDVSSVIGAFVVSNSQGTGGLLFANDTIYAGTSSGGATDVLNAYDPDGPFSGIPLHSATLGGGVVSMAYDEGRDLIYALSNETDELSILNADDLTVAAGPLSTVDQPLRVVYDSVTDRIFVLGSGDPAELEVFDAQTLTPEASPVPLSDDPHGIAVVSPDNGGGGGVVGQRYFVASRNSNLLGVYNATDFSEETTVDMGETMLSLALDAANGFLYVGLISSGDVVRLDSTDLTPTGQSFSSGGSGGLGPADMVFDETGNNIYVTNYSAGVVTGVDATNLISLGGPGNVFRAAEVAVDRTRNLVYVTRNDGGASAVFRFDADTLAPASPPSVNTVVNPADFADGLAYDAVNEVIYVGNDSLGSVPDHFVTIDAATLVTNGIPADSGSRIISIAVDNEHDLLYLCCFGTNTVEVWDTSLDPLMPTHQQTLTVGNSPAHVEYEPGRDRLLVANEGSNSVSVFDVSTGTAVEIPGSPFPVVAGPYMIIPDTTSVAP